MNKHPNSFLLETNLGRSFPPYEPTFALPGEYIDDFHSSIGSSAKGAGLVNLDASLGIPIKGWLRPPDALNLYEMGYFVAGDILELGSYHSLSTCILSEANHAAGCPKHIYSVDLSADNGLKTKESLRATRLDCHDETTCSEAAAAVQRFAEEGKRPGFTERAIELHAANLG